MILCTSATGLNRRKPQSRYTRHPKGGCDLYEDANKCHDGGPGRFVRRKPLGRVLYNMHTLSVGVWVCSSIKYIECGGEGRTRRFRQDLQRLLDVGLVAAADVCHVFKSHNP